MVNSLLSKTVEYSYQAAASGSAVSLFTRSILSKLKLVKRRTEISSSASIEIGSCGPINALARIRHRRCAVLFFLPIFSSKTPSFSARCTCGSPIFVHFSDIFSRSGAAFHRKVLLRCYERTRLVPNIEPRGRPTPIGTSTRSIATSSFSFLFFSFLSFPPRLPELDDDSEVRPRRTRFLSGDSSVPRLFVPL